MPNEEGNSYYFDRIRMVCEMLRESRNFGTFEQRISGEES
jgi:hypothetical protein